MDGWTVEAVFYVGCLVFAGLCLAWAATFGVRGLLNDLDPKQSDDVPCPPTKGVVRRRRAMMPGAQGYPGITAAPTWRFR